MSSPPTNELIRELQQAWEGKLLAEERLAMPRKFGEIYFAPLAYFAKGEPHFGMVRGRGGKKHRQGGVIRFSPITSRKPGRMERSRSIAMAAGTPLGRDASSTTLDKDSWMLLGLGPIPVRRSKLREHMESHAAYHVGRLPEKWLKQVREKLESPKPQ